MSTILLQTKLYRPPLRPSLVSRARLIEKAALGAQKKLTLVLAPAGFGKTTLVLDWLDQQTQPAAWFSLDAEDNDPRRFLTYLLAACQYAQPDLGQKAVSLLEALSQDVADISFEPVLITLLNDIAASPSDMTIVLDDFQVIESELITQLLTFLIDFAPPQLHLIITSRKEPDLPLSRWRGRGDLVLIDFQDLRFTAVESAQYLQGIMGITLSAEELGILETRTEGWITGLHLAAISMQKSGDVSAFVAAFRGSNRYVLDYLMDEVLRRQPPEIRTFLQQTAVLKRLCAPLCAAVTRNENSARLLKQLEDENLFLLPLDEERRWYRLHTLMRDLLLNRLQQKDAGQLSILHGRAAFWYAEQGLADEAINHALAAGENALAGDIIADKAPEMFRHGRLVTLQGWLNALPAEQIKVNARLGVALALIRLLTGAFKEIDAVFQPLVDAEKALAGMDKPDQILGEIMAIRAVIFIESGASEKGLKLAEEAEELLSQDDSEYHAYLRGALAMMRGLANRDLGQTETAVHVYQSAITLNRRSRSIPSLLATEFELSKLWLEEGKLNLAEQLHRQSISDLENLYGPGAAALPLSGAAHIGLGKILYEWNRLDEARQHLETGIERTSQNGGLGLDRSGRLTLSLLLNAQGDISEANTVIAKAEAHARRSLRQDALLRFWPYQIRLWLAQDNVAAAARWAERQSVDLDQTGYSAEITAVSLARIHLALEQPQQALAILQAYLPVVESGRRYGRLLEMLVLLAQAHQQLDQDDQALAFLTRSLKTAEPGGYIRLYLDAGQSLASLIYTAVQQGHSPAYGGMLLANFTEQAGAETAPPSPAPDQPALIEPLSVRELEVLELVSTGLTNREIGLRLHLSPNTIKRHTLTIYEKLDVHNRTEAVNKARSLGLLS